MGALVSAAGLLGLPGLAQAAIQLDSTSSAATAGASKTLTFDHTIGSGSRRLLVVLVTTQGGNQDQPDAVTYNGASMLHVATISQGGNPRIWASMWYLLDASLPRQANASLYSLDTVGSINHHGL